MLNSIRNRYTVTERRPSHLHAEIEALVSGTEPRPDARGALTERDKPLLFTTARLDRIKNISTCAFSAPHASVSTASPC